MNLLQRYIVWLRRIAHCRGFGVQSPSAYRFIRYVISEHYPYYAYDDLRETLPEIDWLIRKRMELYFRIVNFCRPSVFVDYSTDSSILAAYAAKGCHATRTVNALGGQDFAGPVRLVRVCPVKGSEDFLAKALEMADESSIFIIEDIAVDDTARRMWQTLVENDKVSVSYDLYYCGVVFFDTKRNKENYKVNF